MKHMAKAALIFMITFFCIFFMKSRDCDAFRCGSGLVSAGDTKAKVLIECGNPTYTEKGNKKSGTTGGSSRQKTGKAGSQRIDKWYYNCGDNDFIYVLEFESNVLQKENTAGRGKGPSDCRGNRQE
ncbi:MAG: DUF2845 domain-containing protein [Deltaproteobacteria bacterium]|nr:DUF2845 domain-containing protein [Deltaproteobacteria bacterium]